MVSITIGIQKAPLKARLSKRAFCVPIYYKKTIAFIYRFFNSKHTTDKLQATCNAKLGVKLNIKQGGNSLKHSKVISNVNTGKYTRQWIACLCTASLSIRALTGLKRSPLSGKDYFFKYIISLKRTTSQPRKCLIDKDAVQRQVIHCSFSGSPKWISGM